MAELGLNEDTIHDTLLLEMRDRVDIYHLQLRRYSDPSLHFPSDSVSSALIDIFQLAFTAELGLDETQVSRANLSDSLDSVRDKFHLLFDMSAEVQYVEPLQSTPGNRPLYHSREVSLRFLGECIKIEIDRFIFVFVSSFKMGYSESEAFSELVAEMFPPVSSVVSVLVAMSCASIYSF